MSLIFLRLTNIFVLQGGVCHGSRTSDGVCHKMSFVLMLHVDLVVKTNCLFHKGRRRVCMCGGCSMMADDLAGH